MDRLSRRHFPEGSMAKLNPELADSAPALLRTTAVHLQYAENGSRTDIKHIWAALTPGPSARLEWSNQPLKSSR